MIALLRGRLAVRETDAAVVDVNGVGYLVHVPAPLLRALPDDRDFTLHILTVVREDAITLYGFESPAARDTFELLRGVTGVGPKIALAILSTLSNDQLADAIGRGDVRALTTAPGVGKKLAERLCLELENKLTRGFTPTSARVVGPEDPLPLALARLEYKKSEIDVAMASDAVPKYGEAPTEARLRAALALLMKAR